jgi:hypothetical protein
LFKFFFGYHGSTSNLEHACKNLGGLGTLVREEIENEQTVHKPKLKFIYRYIDEYAILVLLHLNISDLTVDRVSPLSVIRSEGRVGGGSIIS